MFALLGRFGQRAGRAQERVRHQLPVIAHHLHPGAEGPRPGRAASGHALNPFATAVHLQGPSGAQHRALPQLPATCGRGGEEEGEAGGQQVAKSRWPVVVETQEECQQDDHFQAEMTVRMTVVT